jgi:type IV pilus assembly protein PilN
MARINLLPWREAERKRRQREFLVMSATALAATLAVALGLRFHVNGLITSQEERNQFLQTEIGLLNKQISEIQDLEKTKANLLARMNVIQQLQESRPEVVHLFDELVIGIPEGVYLTKIDQSGRSVVLEGRAQSNARVSAFMRNIESSEWIGKPLLLLIEHKDKTGTGLSHFRLRFEQLKASGEEQEAAT